MSSINSEMLKSMVLSASNSLQNNRALINDYNVFPVPDGDTGTNMSLTFSGAAAQIKDDGEKRCGALLSKLASAALRNARGNSGVILSQILRGISKGADGAEELGVKEIKNAAAFARDVAYRAVMKPTEGTILTVVRNVAEFAEANFKEFKESENGTEEFLQALLKEAQRSLETTKDILPVLKQAGVVDAGGKGVVTLLEGAVYALINGREIELLDKERDLSKRAVKQVDTGKDIKFLYCTEFLINKKKERQAKQFTTAISDKGDCMLVIEDGDIVKVHIHTNHPGFVIEQALRLGELTNLKIDNMKYQHSENVYKSEEKQNENSGAEETENGGEPKKYGFVAVSAGAGLTEIFKSLNVDKTVEGGQTMNPSTQDLLDAVSKINAENIFILPNNKNIIMAAEQVKELSEKNVFVVPTKNIPQGISAMIGFSAEAEPKENAAAMEAAASEVACGQVTYAARDTVIDGKVIKEGDVMGLTSNGIEAVGGTAEDACFEIAKKLADDETGLISVYYGSEVKKEDAEKLKELLEDEFLEADVRVSYGGQPVYYYIISAE